MSERSRLHQECALQIEADVGLSAEDKRLRRKRSDRTFFGYRRWRAMALAEFLGVPLKEVTAWTANPNLEEIHPLDERIRAAVLSPAMDAAYAAVRALPPRPQPRPPPVPPPPHQPRPLHKRAREEGEVYWSKKVQREMGADLDRGLPVWIDDETSGENFAGRDRPEAHTVVELGLPPERREMPTGERTPRHATSTRLRSLADHGRTRVVASVRVRALGRHFSDEITTHLCDDDAAAPCMRCLALISHNNMKGARRANIM